MPLTDPTDASAPPAATPVPLGAVPPLERPADLPRDLAGLRRHFAPVFARIAEGSRERDRRRILPFEEVRALNEAGFATLRVPADGLGLEAEGVEESQVRAVAVSYTHLRAHETN